MILIKAAAISMALLAVPAIAQSLSDTHELQWNQAGKVPAVHYRPVKKSCVQQAAPIHLSGKTPYIVHAKSGSNCTTEIASREQAATTEKQ
ncbi:hypothetical protein BH09PSE3_BH09PSE3_25200 [soil metagenome]